MGTLERVLAQTNLQQPSPSQVQQSPYLATQPQAIQQPNPTLQAQPWAYQEQQVAPTSYTNASQIQTSSPASTASSNQALSNVSAEVVEHFGIEAPGILNQYACALEDLLIDQAQRMDALASRSGAMETILTNPDQLAEYTDRFFTEVVPVDIDEPVAQGQPQAYQPSYDMPAPPANAGGSVQGVNPQNQWEAFSEVMNRSPENAWRYLQGMGPDALRSKLLFMEGA